MTVHDRLEHLKQQTAAAEGTGPLLRVLDEISQLESEQEAGGELDGIRLEAFDALARLTQEHASDAAPVILGHLLPLCLRDKGGWRNPGKAYLYDEALAAWLGRFPTGPRQELRAAILQVLADSLPSAAERACRLICMVGYR